MADIEARSLQKSQSVIHIIHRMRLFIRRVRVHTGPYLSPANGKKRAIKPECIHLGSAHADKMTHRFVWYIQPNQLNIPTPRNVQSVKLVEVHRLLGGGHSIDKDKDSKFEWERALLVRYDHQRLYWNLQRWTVWSKR